MEKILIDTLGWMGTGFYLIAYILVSTRKVAGSAVSYQMMNLVGGITSSINTYYYHSLPAVAANLMWMGVAMFALGRGWFPRK